MFSSSRCSFVVPGIGTIHGFWASSQAIAIWAVVSVALFDLWNNGQIGEVAALGCIWTAIMTIFSVVFLIVSRRHQLPIG